ncbi:hypothetical protein Mal65_04840 [Crateriforma conspicua]|nr:hypothetical protein Mal65_04840 [Crateriforma conspicua]
MANEPSPGTRSSIPTLPHSGRMKHFRSATADKNVRTQRTCEPNTSAPGRLCNFTLPPGGLTNR